MLYSCPLLCNTFSIHYSVVVYFSVLSLRISIAMLIKSLSRLSAKFSLLDEICDQPLCASLLLSLFYGHVEVQSSVVEQLEGSHGMPRAQLHRRVHIAK